MKKGTILLIGSSLAILAICLVLRFKNKFIVYWKIRVQWVDQKSVCMNILRNHSTNLSFFSN